MDDYLEEIVSAKYDEMDFLESFDEDPESSKEGWSDEEVEDLMAYFSE